MLAAAHGSVDHVNILEEALGNRLEEAALTPRMQPIALEQSCPGCSLATALYMTSSNSSPSQSSQFVWVAALAAAAASSSPGLVNILLPALTKHIKKEPGGYSDITEAQHDAARLAVQACVRSNVQPPDLEVSYAAIRSIQNCTLAGSHLCLSARIYLSCCILGQERTEAKIKKSLLSPKQVSLALLVCEFQGLGAVSPFSFGRFSQGQRPFGIILLD